MLLGRERELTVIDELVRDVRAERGRVLAVVGEAGIGKTALLEAAVGRADGLRVLRMQGFESETVVPNAGLDALIRPLRGSFEQLSAEARHPLDRVFGSAPTAAV
jgi:predicted ATPase